MNTSNYTINQNFTHFVLKQLTEVIPMLCLHPDDISNLKKMIKRGSNRIKTQGHMTIALKPLLMMLSERVSTEEKVTDKFIQMSLEKELPFISRNEISNGILKIFFDQKFLLCLSLPTLSDKIWNTKLLSMYKIRINIPSKEEDLNLTKYRCYLIACHMKNFFEMNGASVNVEKLREEELCNTEEINSLNQHLKYRVSSISPNKEGDQNLVFCSAVVQKTNGSKLMLGHDDYIDQLKNELQRASQDKAESFETIAMKSYFENLAESCLILQLMAVNHLSNIKIDVEKESQNSRASAFILYNHARLCTLFSNLDKLIEAEVVPSVPPITEVDFSLLRHSEEWDLFWLFIHKYPELIEDVANEILNNSTEKSRDGSTLPCFPTHTITKFLHRLAHCLSVYYNRIHILPSISGGSKMASHLLPVLWSRIYLLKGVYWVLRSGLESLNISPPEVM